MSDSGAIEGAQVMDTDEALLRKRFQRTKERLRELARLEGVLPERG